MIPLIYQEEVLSISVWIPIMKSYRYEMTPSKNQEVKLIRTLEICRHLNNWSNGERKDSWENGGWRVTYNDQQDHLKILRNGLDKENKELGKELNEVYEQVAQNQLHRVDLAYQRFFERVENNKKNPEKYKKPGHPRFKGINRMKSFTFPQYGNGCHIVDKYGNEDQNGDFIKLSKIGIIPFIKHKEMGEGGIPYKIKSVTVKKEVDKWILIPTVSTFAEIKIPIDIYKKLDLKPLDNLIYDLFEAKRNKNKIYDTIKKELNNLLHNTEAGNTGINAGKKEIKTIEELKEELDLINKKCTGNDMGLPNLMTDSNGKKTEAPKYLEKSAKRLRKEQQKLSRKKIYDITDESTGKVKRDLKTGKKIWKGSKNRDRQVIEVAKTHIYIANQRRNYGHIISKEKVKDNDLNVFEKLYIQKMMKDRRFSKGIADASWGQVQRFTEYKAEWAGKMVDFVDPVYTSQSCSNCGAFVGKVEGEIFRCPFCKLEINVHENAARNIRNRSEVYRSIVDKMIFQRLSSEMKEKIKLSEGRTMDKIYLWSLDPEDSWTNDEKKRVSRDAAARIYAFGEVTSTHVEICEQVAPMNQEASLIKGGSIENTSIQAPPFRAGWLTV